ncbi:MAG: pyridoxal-phosphate dependent enzyme [Thermoplasmatota archaeon]
MTKESDDNSLVNVKRRIGKTPLIRARNLEKELGLQKIYLKLEGNNPSGERSDRLAYLIIKDALSRGKDTICLGTYGTMGASLAFLSQNFDINLVLYVPDKSTLLRADLLEEAPNIRIIEHGSTYEDTVEKSRAEAEAHGWYNANPGLQNNFLDLFAFSYIGREICEYLGDECPDTVFCQMGNGASVSGLHLGFKQMWMMDRIRRLPRLYGVSTSEGNAIVESFRQRSDEIIELDAEEIASNRTEYNADLINARCYNGQDALNSLYATDGRAMGISDEELVETAERFAALEDIDFKVANSFPLAAFFREINAGNLSDGTHIVVLNDGKVDLDIRVLEKDDLSISFRRFLMKLDDWLIDFSDPLDEMEEAVENAFTHGFVLGAFYQGVLSGIAIVSATRFDTFFPRYHLSYIATKRDTKGRGIATELLQRVIDLTRGDLSLHVETDNERAIKLYEKMGLRKKYYRMMYEGEVIT